MLFVRSCLGLVQGGTLLLGLGCSRAFHSPIFFLILAFCGCLKSLLENAHGKGVEIW